MHGAEPIVQEFILSFLLPRNGPQCSITEETTGLFYQPRIMLDDDDDDDDDDECGAIGTII
jgi:hypothetical protein